MLQDEVKKHRENSNIYKLFIGFKKLGEFNSIQEAKMFAKEMNVTGRFSLLGDKYYDTWYVCKWDIVNEEAKT